MNNISTIDHIPTDKLYEPKDINIKMYVEPIGNNTEKLCMNQPV